jgi:hypothetical protein
MLKETHNPRKLVAEGAEAGVGVGVGVGVVELCLVKVVVGSDVVAGSGVESPPTLIGAGGGVAVAETIDDDDDDDPWSQSPSLSGVVVEVNSAALAEDSAAGEGMHCGPRAFARVSLAYGGKNLDLL